jgi:hypothetical protein
MSEKKRKPRKLKVNQENGLNVVNKEKLNSKKETKIKEDVLDLEFETFKTSAGDSEYITESFGKRTNNLNDEVIDYFYNEKLGILYDNRRLGNSVFGNSAFGGNINLPDFRTINAHNVYVYQLNCYKKLEEALGIPKIILGFK